MPARERGPRTRGIARISCRPVLNRWHGVTVGPALCKERVQARKGAGFMGLLAIRAPRCVCYPLQASPFDPDRWTCIAFFVVRRSSNETGRRN